MNAPNSSVPLATHRVWLVLSLAIAGCACLPAQSTSVMVRQGVKVLPVYFIPTDGKTPTGLEQSSLMRHLYWAQSRFSVLLNARGTFELAGDRPAIHNAKFASSYYESQPESSAPAFVDEWLSANNYNRMNCPYVLVFVYRGTNERFPSAAGGRPINGWLNEGGGVVILSVRDTASNNFQSTLQHELGHSFGLLHVDAYGYDMTTNNSIMSYNPKHWTNYFEDSSTPGILNPEDIRALALNKLVFPNLTFTSADIPAGYKIVPTTFILPAMTLPNQPPYTAVNQFFSRSDVRSNIRQGQAELLVASLSDLTTVRWEWRKDGALLSGATGASVRLERSRLEDSGEYTATAILPGDARSVSNTARVTVVPPVSISTSALSPASAAFGQTGGDNVLTLNVTPADANWTATSNTDWATVLSGATGTGSWTVMYSVARNPQSTVRSGQIHIAGKVFVVTQGPPGVAGPAVTGIEGTVLPGRSARVILSGQNLDGARITSNHSGISFSAIEAASARISASISVDAAVVPGDYVLTATTGAGTAAFTFAVTPDPSMPTITSVVNAASFRPEVAPNTWISVFGRNLGLQESARSVNETELGGASVSVCGIPATLSFNSGTGQINALVPPSVGTGRSCPVVATLGHVSSAPFAVMVNPRSLGIFLYNVGEQQFPVATHADFTVIGPPSAGLLPASSGETIILWCTGWNSEAPRLTVQVGGKQAAVVYYGPASGVPGLCQINAILPEVSPGETTITVDQLGPYNFLMR